MTEADRVLSVSWSRLRACTRCKITKSSVEFSRNSASKDGRYSIYRQCVSQRARKRDTDPPGKRTCNICWQLKDENLFPHVPKNDGKKRRPAACTECSSKRKLMRQQTPGDSREKYLESQKKYRLSSAESSWSWRLSHLYGMSSQNYYGRLKNQAGVCCLCSGEETYKGKAAKLSVDHDHKCCPGSRSCGQCIRGLLCRNCNTKLDWAERIGLLKLEEYLNGN